jgi:hypothetical protein
MSVEDLDRDARLLVYDFFVERGGPPSLEEAAAAPGCLDENVADSFSRLEAAHVLVFAPGTSAIWMASRSRPSRLRSGSSISTRC